MPTSPSPLADARPVDGSSSARVVVLTTGGTIAGAATHSDDHSGYVAGALGAAELLRAVPPLADLPLETEAVGAIDSKDMGPGLWRPLVMRLAHHLARQDVAGVVVTHGTDTLEETVWLLQRVLSPVKPVMMVAAMRPSTALSADGPQNLLDAVRAARVPALAGVHACFGGRIWAAQDVHKRHSYQVDAFGAVDASPVAMVVEGKVLQIAVPHGEAAERARGPAFGPHIVQRPWPWVGLLTSHADARPEAVRAWVAAGLQGLVVAGTGAGTVHAAWQAPLAEAQAAGVALALATRCAAGPVLARTEPQWRVYAGLSAVKARVELALELMAGDDGRGSGQASA
jgi:L-asparaginase